MTKSVEISVVYLNADVYKISSPYCQYYKSDTASERQRVLFVLPSSCPAVFCLATPLPVIEEEQRLTFRQQLELLVQALKFL